MAIEEDGSTMADKLDLIKKRMAEAAEAYGDDVEGLRAEAERIGAEAGVPVELQHIDITSPVAAVEHLLGIAAYLSDEVAALKDDVVKLSVMVIDLIEATSEGNGLQWCEHIVAKAKSSIAEQAQAETEAEAEAGD